MVSIMVSVSVNEITQHKLTELKAEKNFNASFEFRKMVDKRYEEEFGNDENKVLGTDNNATQNVQPIR